MPCSDFVVPPPCCGYSVTDFWGWDAQGTRFRRPDDDGKVMDESVVSGGALNLISTNYPDHGHHGLFPIQGKTHTLESGIEPGTSWLVARHSDH
jgi:hypothetical protein